jgi:hypothetical protein
MAAVTEAVPIAPYYQNLIAAMAVPGNSITILDQYFRTADIARWTGSDFYSRYSQSAVRLTVDYMARPLIPLPVPDLTAAAKSIADTVAAAVLKAGADAYAADLQNAQALQNALQNNPSGGG